MQPQIHKAAGGDSVRHEADFIRVDKNNCVATDRHVLAVVPTADVFRGLDAGINDEVFFIHKSQAVSLYPKVGYITNYTLDLENKTIVARFTPIKRGKHKQIAIAEIELDVKFPDFETIVNSAKKRKAGFTPTIGLNPSLLKTAAEAIGASTLRLEIREAGQAVIVSDSTLPSELVKAYALVMPYLVEPF